MRELIERANKVIEEAKALTTKQREKLPDSVYCGPQKSFPINDCTRYTAALRLLNRSKFSDATKKKIKACIIRKGKKLGCPGAKEKSSYLTKEIIELYDSEEWASTKELIEKSLENPGMELDFTGC